MKIQFILPKCDNPGARLIRGWAQPLGMLLIATYIELHNADQHPEIEFLDGTVLSREEIINRIDADIVGISAITRVYPRVLELAEIAKHKGATVVLGGQYASALGEVILRNRPFIDYVIRYDGESAFSKLIAGVPLSTIKNLIYRDGNRIVANDIELLDINTLPMIRREFLDLSPYDGNYQKNIGGPFRRAGTIYSQRGCCWRSTPQGGCVFCIIPDFTWRLRNPKSFWDEVVYLSSLGFEFLYDIADDIGADKNWLRELYRTKPDVAMHFRHYLGAKNTTEEVVQILKEIGSVHIFIGFESSVDSLLRNTNKEASLADNFRALNVLQKFNMPLLASFVGGLPGETKESIDRTMEFTKYVSELPITAALHWDVLKPMPGSKAFQMVLRHPVLGKKYTGKDLINFNEMRKDWVQYFCNVDFDYLSEMEDKANELVVDNAIYAPLDN